MNGKSDFAQLSRDHKKESLGWSLKTVMKNEVVGGSRAGNQARLPHHWPVDIPKGPFLTIQDFPLCLILFPVNPERVKRGHEKTLYYFLFCHLSSPAPGAKADPRLLFPVWPLRNSTHGKNLF